MSKETVVNVHLKFVITETGMFPPLEGKCQIACTGLDGKEWKGSISYDNGRSVEDAIKTICRMDSFRSTLPRLAVVASELSEPSPAKSKPKAKPVPKSKKPPAAEKASETPVADAYAGVRADLMKHKIGGLRKIISDQNMDLTTGGKKKEVVVEQIIAVLKQRDGITEETTNEEA